jgi:hypothetical protein
VISDNNHPGKRATPNKQLVKTAKQTQTVSEKQNQRFTDPPPLGIDEAHSLRRFSVIIVVHAIAAAQREPCKKPYEFSTSRRPNAD